MPMPTFPDEIVRRLAMLMVLAVIVLPFMVEYPREVVVMVDAVSVEPTVNAPTEIVLALMVNP